MEGLQWRLELVHHLMPQLAAARAGLAVLALAARQWRWALALALATGWNAGQLSPWLTTPPTPAHAGTPLTLFSANVLRMNTDSERLVAQLQAADADLVVLLEVDDRWLADLAPALGAYSYRVEHPLDTNFGLAVYARFPLSDTEIFQPGPPLAHDTPAVRTRVLAGDQPLTLWGVHTVPPVSATLRDARDAQLQDLAARIAATPPPHLVAGDLNTTLYTDRTRALLDGTDLVDARAGDTTLGTWPAGLPASLRIPIDHVLASPELSVRQLRVGELTGSDHRPLIVELTLAP